VDIDTHAQVPHRLHNGLRELSAHAPYRSVRPEKAASEIDIPERDKEWFTKWKPMKDKWLESVQSSNREELRRRHNGCEVPPVLKASEVNRAVLSSCSNATRDVEDGSTRSLSTTKCAMQREGKLAFCTVIFTTNVEV